MAGIQRRRWVARVNVLALIAAILVAGFVGKTLFCVLFEDMEDCLDCLRFSLTPDLISMFRGEMEHRIKEQPLGLFTDRTSRQAWWANQFRVLLSACAYTLMVLLRTLGLKGTEPAQAQAGTIRLRLLIIGTVITRNTRRVSFHLPSSFTHREIFAQAVEAVDTT